MTLRCRCGKDAEPDRTECFNCRVRTVGFAFIGGGGYTRDNWNRHTITEKRTEVLGDRVLGEDVDTASNHGW